MPTTDIIYFISENNHTMEQNQGMEFARIQPHLEAIPIDLDGPLEAEETSNIQEEENNRTDEENNFDNLLTGEL